MSDSSWGSSGTPNSFAWALAQANGNLGADTISDDLTIQGHGATLVGNPMVMTSGGTLYTKTNVDAYNGPPLGTDILLQPAVSFGKLAPGVSLTIEALHSDGLNGDLQLGTNSTASISGSAARNSVSYGVMARPVFEALSGSTLNLSEVVLERINPALESIGPAWSGAIAGVNASLNMARSSISQAAAAAGAVVWNGGVANVVTSLINASGGLSIRDDSQPGVVNLVNSLISVSAQNSDIQQLQALDGGEMTITASSLLLDALYNAYNQCNSDPYGCVGKPLTAFDGGTITLKQSVVSLINSLVIPAGVTSYSSADLGYGGGAGQLVALDSVWVQPTPNQSAAALQALFANNGLLTSGIPLNVQDFGGGVSAYVPWPGGAYPNPNGPLINQISDANGANQLINPIDGSPIQRDVFGSPRTSNGLRTIGAVQPASVPAPLPVAGATAALAWSRRLRSRIRHRRSAEAVQGRG